MKILEDISIFKNQRAKIFDHWDNVILSEHGKAADYIQEISYNERPKNVPLYTNFFGHRNSSEFYFQRRIRPNFLSVEFILSGEHYLCCGKQGFIAEAGDLVFLHPQMDHYILSPEHTDCEKYGICISGTKLISILKALDLDHIRCIKIKDTSSILSRIEDIHKSLVNTNKPIDFTYNASMTFGLLQQLSQLSSHNAIHEDIDKVLEYFERHLSKKINMPTVASLIHRSLPTFNKLFQQTIGTTPHQYLINLRMQHAYELLKNSNHSIKEIASMVGYNSPIYFTLEFKKIYGKAPSKTIAP